MAERWTVVAATAEQGLVQIRLSDGAVSIRDDMTRVEMLHAIAEMAKRIHVLQQILAER